LELARLLAREQGLPLLPGALVRVRHTRPQSTLPARERERNIAGAFRADPALVGGARVLLVDDVMTTGSTLKACARELRAAGAEGVEALVVARA
ncbi:MAG: ComF family protein, partial [Desulfovibrionaceae bacterium]